MTTTDLEVTYLRQEHTEWDWVKYAFQYSSRTSLVAVFSQQNPIIGRCFRNHISFSVLDDYKIHCIAMVIETT